MIPSLIHVYTGDGKGKTTASIGLSVRALGRNFKVKIYQFFKSDFSGELDILNKLGIETIQCNSQKKASWTMNDNELEILKNDTLLAWDIINKEIKLKKFDLIILDEINHALHRNFISEKQVNDLFYNNASTELVFTGRNAPQWLIEKADYVTEMKLHKHPMENGITARIGIEK